MPKQVGSSAVKITSSMDRRGWNPLDCRARIASSPPSTPTVPSKRPALGIASMWDPVATAGKLGSVPAQRGECVSYGIFANHEPAARASDLMYSRARKSVSVKTTRVTAGGGASENVASRSSSDSRRALSTVSTTDAG